MAKKAAKSAIPKWKKKKWIEIIAPQIYSEKVVGETLAEFPDVVLGRVIELNMMTLMGNPRKQNFNIKLRVEKVSGNKGFTKPIKLTMLNSSVRRLIRPGRERVDFSFVVVSKDGVKLRIKPLLITKTKAVNSVKSSLQLKAKELITEFIEKNTYEAVFDSVTASTLQKNLKTSLDKVFPLKMLEIRDLEVEIESGLRKITGFVETKEEEVIKTEE